MIWLLERCNLLTSCINLMTPWCLWEKCSTEIVVIIAFRNKKQVLCGSNPPGNPHMVRSRHCHNPNRSVAKVVPLKNTRFLVLLRIFIPNHDENHRKKTQKKNPQFFDGWSSLSHWNCHGLPVIPHNSPNNSATQLGHPRPHRRMR